jgi:hypothetical protein
MAAASLSTEVMAKRAGEGIKWPRFAAVVFPSEVMITLAPLQAGLTCKHQHTLLALEFFQKAYAQHIAQQVKEMKIQKFFSGVVCVWPESRKNPVDTRVIFGNHSNPVDALYFWNHSIAMVWGLDVFLEAAAEMDYGKLDAVAGNHVVTSYGGCGAQVALEPKWYTGSSVESVDTPFLSVEYRVQGTQSGIPSHVVLAVTTF